MIFEPDFNQSLWHSNQKSIIFRTNLWDLELNLYNLAKILEISTIWDSGPKSINFGPKSLRFWQKSLIFRKKLLIFRPKFRDINWAKIIEDSTTSTIIVEILTNIFENPTEDILVWKISPLHNREMKYQHAWRLLAGSQIQNRLLVNLQYFRSVDHFRLKMIVFLFKYEKNI